MNTKMVMVIVAALGAGGLAGYWLAGARQTVSAPTAAVAERPGSQAQTEHKVLYWHDPMKPDVKFDKPGKSPFMDMQLVPVYAEESRNEGAAVTSSRTTQSLGMRTADVLRGALDLTVNAAGAVAVDERSLVTVQARVNGIIEQLYVRAQYDPVARGAPLAAIYSPDWLAAEEEYLALKRNAAMADATLVEAARQRLVWLGVPEAQIRQVEGEGKPNPRVTLLAPESGLVWEIGAREGAAVGPGVTIFRIASLGSVWVNAEIPEAQAGLVGIGAPVEVRTSAFPDRVLKGAVAAILPDVNTQTRTLKARVVVANPGGYLKPGMFANLTFHASTPVREVLLVPSEAVIRTGRRSVVIVAGTDGGLRPVEVEVGREAGDRTEIRKGLDAGQKVVVSGQFLIDSEASLKSALDRMTGAENPHPPAAATTSMPPAAPIDKAMGPRMDAKP
jgi:Cu(I)/Ag(I) efflux system membrane fusion protein